MHKILMTCFLSGAVGLGMVPFTASASHADNLQLKLGKHGPRLELQQDCDPDQQDCRDDQGDRRGDRHGCSEDRALDKADRMGIHRARVAFSNRRVIKVKGFDHGDRVGVTFGRDRGCPVLDRD